MDYIYIYLAVFPAGSFFGGVKSEKVFFFSSEDFSPPRSAFVCFFCTPRPEKKHRMGKRGRASEIEFAKGKGRRKMTGGRAKLSCFSFTRPLVGTGSY